MESAIADLYPGADLADAYAMRLSLDSSRSIVVLARCVLGNPAPWVQVLMGLRDTIMTRFGSLIRRLLSTEILGPQQPRCRDRNPPSARRTNREDPRSRRAS